MYRLIFIIVCIASFAFSKEEISIQTGIGVSDSNKKACEMAIENAKRDAIQQAEVILYSEFETKKESINGNLIEKVKKNLNIHSYGKAKVLEKLDIKLTTDTDTFQSTCKIKAKIAVDTSLMKDEIKRNIKLIEKNQEKELANLEAQKLKALNEKKEYQNRLKYEKLKKELNKSQIVNENISTVCDSSISLDKCKENLNSKLIQPIIKSLSQKYSVNMQNIGIENIEFVGKPQIDYIEGGYRYRCKGEFLVKSYLSGNPFEKEGKAIKQKQEVVIYKNYMWQNHSFEKKYTWDEANSYCKSLVYKGYSNWRLPTQKELRLIHTEHRNENKAGHHYYIEKIFIENMPKCCPWFWTSTQLNSSFYWNVNFGYGIDSWFLKSIKFYVLCIRDI